MKRGLTTTRYRSSIIIAEVYVAFIVVVLLFSNIVLGFLLMAMMPLTYGSRSGCAWIQLSACFQFSVVGPPASTTLNRCDGTYSPRASLHDHSSLGSSRWAKCICAAAAALLLPPCLGEVCGAERLYTPAVRFTSCSCKMPSHLVLLVGRLEAFVVARPVPLLLPLPTMGPKACAPTAFGGPWPPGF